MSDGTPGTCASCGAALAGRVCAYCGVLAVVPDGVEAESLAVSELHRHLHEATPERAASLLVHAFLPSAPAALVDAGTRTLPLLDDAMTTDPVARSAAKRLEAIAAKLRIVGAGATVAEQGAAVFEARVARFQAALRAEEASSNRAGAIILVVMFGLLAAAAAWAVRACAT